MRTLLFAICCLTMIGSLFSQQQKASAQDQNRGGQLCKNIQNSGDLVAIGTKNKGLAIYNPTKGTLVKSFTDFSKNITSIDFNSDDTKILTSSGDKTIKVIDVSKSQEVDRITVSASVNYALFRSNKKEVLYITDATVVLWDLQEDKELWTFALKKGKFRSLAFKQESNMVAVGGGDRLIHILKLDSGEEITALEDHRDWVRSLSFHPTKELLASGDDSGIVMLWETDNLKLQSKVDDLKARVYGLKFSFNGAYLAYAAESLNIYSLENGLKADIFDNFSANIIGFDLNPTLDNMTTAEDLVPTFKVWDLNLSVTRTLTNDEDKAAPMIYVASPANIKNERVENCTGSCKNQRNNR